MKKKKKKIFVLLFNLVTVPFFFSLSYMFSFMYLHGCFYFWIVHQDSDQQRTFSNGVI